MSHSKEREEKVCLNCGAELIARYCHKCGQENIEPKQSLRGLITHFFNDITHFDGKFFGTVKYLVRRPGFLPKEYNRGRRQSYLDPIRMYVFTSAVFFFIFYSVFDRSGFLTVGSDNASNKSSKQPDSSRARKIDYKKYIPTHDSTAINDDPNPNPDSSGTPDFIASAQYTSEASYDSAQALLPEKDRDGWLERILTHRQIRFKARYGEASKEFKKDFSEKFTHSVPYLLFLSLPLCALYLKLLYIRHKNIYYIEHVIFLIYLYIFSFVVLLAYFGLEGIKGDWWHSGWIFWLEAALFIYGMIYTVISMRRFYSQSRSKTILKFIILNVFASITIAFLFVLFLGLTVIRL